MNNAESLPALFDAGDCGTTIARNLLRTLALRDLQSSSALLDAALEHVLIKSGFLPVAQETLLADLQGWLAGSDSRFEYQHVLLAVRAFDRLGLQRDSRLTELLLTRSYTSADFRSAERLAEEVLRDQEKHADRKLLLRSHDILGRLFSDRSEFVTAAKHFAAGAEAAHEENLDFEEWGQRTNRVSCLQRLGDPLGALREIDNAEEIARRMKSPPALAKTLLDRGNSLLLLGRREDARQAFQGALALAEEAGDRTRESDALGNIGAIAHADQDYAAAEENHRRALAISRTLADKGSAQADLNNLAQALWAQNRSEEAVQAQEEALEIARLREEESQITQYSERLRRMYEVMGRYAAEPTEPESVPRNQPQKSEGLASHSQIRPNYAIEKQVRELLNQGQAETARRSLEQHLKETPGDCTALGLYGTVLAISGDDQSARAQFERAIELCPNAIDAHYRLIDLCTKTGQLDPLLARYERAVADEPFLAAPRLGLALVYSRKQRMDDAIQQAMEAVRLAPDEELSLRVLAEAQLVKAQALLRSNWDGAWSVFQDCIASLNRLTRLHSDQRGQWLNFAARTFEQFAMQSHQINPPLTPGMDSRELSILAHAARFYQQAQKIDPLRKTEKDVARVEDAIVILGRPEQIALAAGHLRSGGSLEEALLLLLLSLQRNPEQAEAYHQLAQLMYEMGGEGSRNAALEYIRRAIQIDPDNGIYTEAERFFQQAPEVPHRSRREDDERGDG